LTRRLHDFPGGIHPPAHKAETSDRPIVSGPLPAQLVVPLRQHIGQPAKPVVQIGDRVRRGQMIGRAADYVSVAVHAPSSGTISAIELRPVAHPSGLPDLCLVIDCDGADETVPTEPVNMRDDPSAVRNCLRDLGLAGLGGAVFPSFIKLNPRGRAVPTLILNGGECEPWITCDDRLMQERADSILAGAGIMRQLLGAHEVLIGVEDNKPAAIAALTRAARGLPFAVEVIAVASRYPAGGAKQLIQTLTGVEVPAGGLATDTGIQCFNVGTAHALHRAVEFGEALTSRIVTVTGHVGTPQNIDTRIGTPMQALIDQTGALSGATGLIMGGPMMGFDLADAAVPVVKSTNCVLVKSAQLFPPPPAALPCIRCGDCARACPASLQPQELYWFTRARQFGPAQELHLMDCIECGCCSYVCPSHIPLVDYYRHAKSEIWTTEKERKAADLARERHEFRAFRLERDKQEKTARLAARTQAKRAEASTEGTATLPAEDPKKALIAAALERAAAKKAAVTPANTEALTPAQAQEITDIETRREQIRTLAKQSIEAENT
jgi:electron transport complex protein RnfC